MTKAQNEAAAIAALHEIALAETRYRDAAMGGTNVGEYASQLGDLLRSGALDQMKFEKATHGYAFKILRGDRWQWAASAIPETPGVTGDRSFYVDETRVIRWAKAGDPLGEPCPAVEGQ